MNPHHRLAGSFGTFVLLAAFPLFAGAQAAPAAAPPASGPRASATSHATRPSSPAASPEQAPGSGAARPSTVHRHRISWTKTLLITAAAAALTGLIVYEETKPKSVSSTCNFEVGGGGCPGGGPLP